MNIDAKDLMATALLCFASVGFYVAGHIHGYLSGRCVGRLYADEEPDASDDVFDSWRRNAG